MNRAEVFLCAGVLPVALAGLIVSQADPHARRVADLCSVMIRNPYIRSERETYFLGSARSDTVQVRISDVPGVLRPRRYPYLDSTPVFGQVVRVQSVYGADADRVLALFGAGDSTVVVINYSFNPACQTFPVRAWFDTGVLDHYTVFLRPDSEWAAGRPTFDIRLLMNGLAVYPGYLRQRRGVNLDTTLTVDQYASLVKVLPVESDWSQDCQKGLERIEAWARTHERSAKTYPADKVIGVMRWSCGVGSK